MQLRPLRVSSWVGSIIRLVGLYKRVSLQQRSLNYHCKGVLYYRSQEISFLVNVPLAFITYAR